MLEPIPVPALSDNYIWLLRSPGASECIVVDPGEADPVLTVLSHHGLNVAAILITHRHGDHVGGLAAVTRQYPNAAVYGPAHERVAGVTDGLSGGDRVDVDALGVSFDVIDTPGHTLGHIAYYGGGILVCGDTLFAGGCGRVFEGTNDQMLASLERLAALPDGTTCCCGHEYTLKNLAFARAVEPDNRAIERREAAAQASHQAGEPTVPFDLADERATNPFLRCDEPSVRAAAEERAGQTLSDRVAVFGVLRDWKNRS